MILYGCLTAVLCLLQDVVGFCIEKLDYAPSVGDNAGYTPLHEACAQGHYQIAKLLLQFGADVSASAQGGIRSVLLLYLLLFKIFRNVYIIIYSICIRTSSSHHNITFDTRMVSS